MNFAFLKSLFFYNDLERHLVHEVDEPPLITKHCAIKSYSVAGKKLNLRVFNLPHYRENKFPALPIVLFIHGMGGSLSQFYHLMDHMSHYAELVAVDLPGHGKSEFQPTDWASYTTERLLDVLETVLSSTCSEDREVVIIGHSMGCVLAAKLANRLGIRCIGMVAITPVAELDEKTQKLQRLLPYVPGFVFDVLRALDRWGGTASKSVSRMVAKEASEEVRLKQLRWNLQVRTPVWMRTAAGLTPATKEEWAALNTPVYLIGAEEDHATPPGPNMDVIHKWLTSPCTSENSLTLVRGAGHAVMVEKPELVCGLINDFITENVDVKLSLGWQLSYLAARDDKWSLKNEDKWRATQCVSAKVGKAPFRAMKTLREHDKEHNPVILEEQYPDITDVIDISRETPPYEPSSFKRIIYHKFPTVSKLPPTKDEVKKYSELVDSILAERKSQGIENPVVATHCHYGFNRTGFFLCSYMIQRLGVSTKDAIAAFAEARPPGIKHPHFIDELYVRHTQ